MASDKPCHGWTLATLKEHYDALRKTEADALTKQAAEYERRLTDLNGAHERLEKTQSISVSREMFDTFKETVVEFMTAQTAKARATAMLVTFLTVAATFSTAAAAFFALRR